MAWLARWDQSPGPNVKDEETRTKEGKKKAEVCREDREAGGETQRCEEQGRWYEGSTQTGLQILRDARILRNLGLKLNALKTFD